MAAKGDTSTLSTWLSQQRALMAAAQHVSTESDVSAHSGPDCSASEGTGMGTVAIINERAGKGGDAVLAATADSADKLRGANSPYVMLMASMKAAMADAGFQKVSPLYLCSAILLLKPLMLVAHATVQPPLYCRTCAAGPAPLCTLRA